MLTEFFRKLSLTAYQVWPNLPNPTLLLYFVTIPNMVCEPKGKCCKSMAQSGELYVVFNYFSNRNERNKKLALLGFESQSCDYLLSTLG